MGGGVIASKHQSLDSTAHANHRLDSQSEISGGDILYNDIRRFSSVRDIFTQCT